MKTPRVHDFDPTAQVPEPPAKVPTLSSPMDNFPSIQKPPAKNPEPIAPKMALSEHVPSHEPREPTTNRDFVNKSTNQQGSKLVDQQVNILASKQISKSVTQLTDKSTNQQINKVVNQQTSKTLKRFGSYLTPESLKELKRIAFESDKKDYEVLQEAVDEYLKRKKVHL
jgi:hypothetical protein